MTLKPRPERKRIGIIAGSGPEAGADLWVKIIEEAKALLGTEYEGDLDGPNVRIVSSPILGLSMELKANDATVRPEILSIYKELAQNCDYIAIACNTLNYYQHALKALPCEAELVSVLDVIRHEFDAAETAGMALLGAAPVMQLDAWSVYQSLTEDFSIEVPQNIADLHHIIYDVKRIGGHDAGVIERFTTLVNGLENDTVLLACTELPLIPLPDTDKNLVDVTQLLAKRLVQKAYCENSER